MSIRPELLQELINTFKVELSENLQVITNGLLALEKNSAGNQADKLIEEIFRAGHNIKGSASSVGVNNVASIAHHIESIFSSIRDKKLAVSMQIINLCLEAVDAMHAAMQSFVNNAPLPFDLNDLINKLDLDGDGTQESKKNNTSSTECFDQQDKSHLATKVKTDIKTTNPSVIKENDTIRVELPQLNKVATLMEELQLSKISIEENFNDIIKLSNKAKPLSHHSITEDSVVNIKNSLNLIRKNMADSINELNAITNSLQEELRTLRLIPASNIIRSLVRTVRDLGNSLNKKVELKIQGDDIRMDKIILESLKDPLTHLLRNAIDHGIETAEIRKASKKPETSVINLNIIDDGDQIYLTIADDGAGIDHEKIAAIAEKKKLLTKAELDKLSESEIINLIFHPGFSTKEIITDISGRGVGLDVVKNNLNNIKGDVTVTTKIHEGTVFQLRFPLTLSGDVGLIIKSAMQFFVIPTSTIEKVLMLSTSEIKTVQGTQVIIINGKPIPLRSLCDILKLDKPTSYNKSQLQIVIIQKGHLTVALIVDEIIGKRDIVIKPLCAPLTNVTCVSGGTLLNGQVVIVLNISDVLNVAANLNNSGLIVGQIVTETPKQQHHILLVDDSITTRTLGKNIFENNNYKVTVAVDGAQAWDLLQKQNFSLMMTDIEMPKMTGLELTERVKQSEKHHDLPVIIVTSLGTDAQIKRGIEVGADAYIVKHNFESKELLAIVEQLL